MLYARVIVLLLFSQTTKKSKDWKNVNADVSMTSPTTPHDADLDQWQCDKWSQLTGQIDPIRIGHMAKFSQMLRCHVAKHGKPCGIRSGSNSKFKNIWGSMGIEPTTTHQAQTP
jgi:hypothetical protein